MNEEGYDSKLAGERNRVQVDKGDERVVDCKVGDWLAREVEKERGKASRKR
jgi:hypothetical protein